jgi:hypothetical protein
MNYYDVHEYYINLEMAILICISEVSDLILGPEAIILIFMSSLHALHADSQIPPYSRLQLVS